MSLFKRKVTTKDNIKEQLAKARWSLNSTHDSNVTVDFTVIKYTVTQEAGELNFSGTVSYSVDTDYGGGPSTIDTTFTVVEGILSVELDSIPWDTVLDFTAIDEYTDEEYGDGTLGSDDDWEDGEDY